MIEPQGMSPAELQIMRAVEDDFWWYRALRRRVLEALTDSPNEFKLLDAGCGSGGMLARLREKFPHASLVGLDVSAEALRLTSARALEIPLQQGRVDQLPFRDGEFDVVLLLDVIYHRGVNDRLALEEGRRVLRAGGKLILNVPAFEFLRGSHDVAVQTERRYTRTRLERLLGQTGFKIERLTYWNMFLFPVIALVRWASRGKSHSDLSPPAPATNKMLASLLNFEIALNRRLALPFGTSLFAIARK